jgi:membrane associated rhomboid family serine protease
LAPLFAHLSTEQFRTYSLVFASADIAHRAYVQETGWCIEIAAQQRHEALRSIRLYRLENQPRPVANPRLAQDAPWSFSAVWAALVLAAVHLAVAANPHPQELMAAFGADAHKIMGGELFRCVTGLLLHHGWPHLVANIAATVLFGTFAARYFGWAVAWLLILLCGALGNYLAAAWYGDFHFSVGASTAIFGAVGLCTIAACWRGLKTGSGPWRPWLPLAAGLALVGWLGTGPRSDLVAHFTGFLSGLLLGGLYSWTVARILSVPAQAAAMGIVAGLIAGSWYWGYGVG